MWNLLLLLCLLILGYIFGRIAEKRHFNYLVKEEHKLGHILSFSERTPPTSINVSDVQLVSGSVVISVDYFKNFVAALKRLLGGRLTSLETLMERGRREAIIRMKQQACNVGAEYIINVKLETSTIAGKSNNGIGSIEVFAYGSALIK